ncbi:unnamed protein product, partial [marine sediment metagenome]
MAVNIPKFPQPLHHVTKAGIGCHAKIFDYLNLSGLYGLHGRNSSNAEGM